MYYKKMKQNNKNCKIGISIPEILMSTLALSILMLGFSQFTSSVFSVSADHSEQLNTVNQARFASERIITQISKASYIYPANVNINLGGGLSINTNSSVAMLIEESDGKYTVIAYYLVSKFDGKANLYEYISSTTYSWAENTCPANNLLTFSGSSSLIARDILGSSAVLSYVMNYSNAPVDNILKGEVASVSYTSKYALIKGINWKIVQANDVTQVKGISRNVPRFFE
jgi:Tfp pilus assembly protein PilV